VIVEEPVRGRIPPPWFGALPGIDRMRAVTQEVVPLPPLSRLLGVRPAHVGPGSGIWTMPATGWSQGATGTLEISMLIESALTGVALTSLPTNMGVEPVTLDIDMFRPTRAQPGNLLARARIVNASRFFVFTEVEIEDPQGRQLAHGASHAEIQPIRPPPPPPPAELRPFEEAAYIVPDPYLRPVTGDAIPDETWAQNDGYTVMRMFADGVVVAPYMQLIGVKIVELQEGRSVLTAPATEWLCRFSRSVCPGQIASFATEALWCAALTMQRRGESLVGLNQSTRFYRPVPADGRLIRAQACGVRCDQSRVFVEVEVHSAEEELIARGQATGVSVDRSRRQKRSAAEVKRALVSLLFIDIVGSTEQAARLGDSRWRALLAQYREAVRAEIVRWAGVEIDTAGDGFFIRFDSPAHAIECARAVRAAAKRIGIELRAGVHTGECELQAGKPTGIAVHIAARIQGAAAPAEILVSGTVRDLLVGSATRFEERGQRALKGISGEWRLFAVAD